MSKYEQEHLPAKCKNNTEDALPLECPRLWWIMMIYTYTLKVYRTLTIITCGVYTFYSPFEVHLCIVTFGLMYG